METYDNDMHTELRRQASNPASTFNSGLMNYTLDEIERLSELETIVKRSELDKAYLEGASDMYAKFQEWAVMNSLDHVPVSLIKNANRKK